MLTNHTLRTSFFPYGPKPDLNLSYNIAGKTISVSLFVCLFTFLAAFFFLSSSEESSLLEEAADDDDELESDDESRTAAACKGDG